MIKQILKETRQERKIKQKDLANELFIEPATLSLIESGKLKIDENRFEVIISILDLSKSQVLRKCMHIDNISLKDLSIKIQVPIDEIEEYLNKGCCTNSTSTLAILNYIGLKTNYVQDAIWVANIGDKVHLNNIDEYEDVKCPLKEEDIFEVISKEKDDEGNQYYTVECIRSKELFECAAIDIEIL